MPSTPDRGLGVEADGHVLQHRQFGKQADILERARHAEPADPVGATVDDIVAAETDVAAGSLVDAAHRVQHGRLARAVGPDQHDDVAAPDGNVHTLDRLYAAEVLVQILDLKDDFIASWGALAGNASSVGVVAGAPTVLLSRRGNSRRHPHSAPLAIEP